LFLALHYAAKLKNPQVIELLAKVSPWHLLNMNGKTFLEETIADIKAPRDDAQELVYNLAKIVSLDLSADPSKQWAALRLLQSWSCDALDDLMLQVGLKSVKREALQLFCTVKEDLKRPPNAQVSIDAMMHFAFVGNPGCGKV